MHFIKKWRKNLQPINKMSKTFKCLWLPLLACCWSMTSCRPAVFVSETDTASAQIDVWEHMCHCLLDWTFVLWFVIAMTAAWTAWHQGYKWLAWIRRQPVTGKVVAILVILSVVFSIGLIPQGIGRLCYSGWFAIPVVTSSLVLNTNSSRT